MRTTLRIDEALLNAAKRYALETGRTLTAVVEDALRQALARRDPAERRVPVRLRTFAGDGLHPGVDLDDSAGLLERMEER